MRGSVMRRAAVRHENPLLRRLIVARLPLLLVIAVVALTTAAAVPVIMVARLSHPHLRVAARHPTENRMSNPRASIQRAVTPPPARAGSAAMADETDDLPAIAAVTPTARPIGKPHGRMRCVNLCLSTPAAQKLRQHTQQRELTLGETLMEIVNDSAVPRRLLRNGRQPTPRRHLSTTNVYVLLTETEATDLRTRATAAGRTISDYTDLAISDTETRPATQR